MADQLELIAEEERVRQILLSRRKANASGQDGADIENIRAADKQHGSSPLGAAGPLGDEDGGK